MPDPAPDNEYPADHSKRPRASVFKRLAFATFTLIGVAVAIEVVAWSAWFLFSGGPFSHERVVAEQEAALQGPFGEVRESDDPADEKRRKKKKRGVLGPLALHPYLGFVYDPSLENKRRRKKTGIGINDYGFLDSGNPIHRRSPDRLIVAVVGGSVAYYVSVDGEKVLRESLREVAGGREVVLVRMALGGWKQPQQLLAISWMLSLGAEFDAVINIDGFNEIALPWPENAQIGVFPSYPRLWSVQTRGVPSSEEKKLLADALLANAYRERWARSFLDSPVRYSVTAQVFWKIRDTVLISNLVEKIAALQAWKPDELPFGSRGPGVPDGLTERELYADLAVQWRRASIQLSQICEANDIRYLHFLQANQYVEGSKPVMSAEERRVAINLQHAYRPGASDGYPYLVAEGGSLREAGVDFHDLTMIFADEADPMYSDDCCHYTEAGNRKVAEHIARAAATAIEASGL
jgi:hypothetical protein